MKVRFYTELAVAIALAAVLDLISKSLPLPHLPYGGSISLRALPILIITLRHGTRAGMTAGGAYGVVDFLIHPVFVHPLQLLLDYPIALGALGGAGWVWGKRAVQAVGEREELEDHADFEEHIETAVVDPVDPLDSMAEKHEEKEAALSPGRLVLGVLLGCGLRLTAHFISGVVFFAQFAPAGQPLWLYSLLYNGSYMAPEAVIIILLLQLILRRMPHL